MMEKKKISFKQVYLIYLAVMAVLVLAAILYVNILLRKYENLRPEVKVKEAMNDLAVTAAEGNMWSKYVLPEVDAGRFEAGRDIKAEYQSLFQTEQMEYTTKSGMHAEDELFYLIKNGNMELAEVKLKAAGPAETKLAVFSYRKWNVEYVKPLLEIRDYTVSVPRDFVVEVNGIVLTQQDIKESNANEVSYFLPGLYQEPKMVIKDRLGRNVNYTTKDDKVIAEFYVYSLTLPSALKVEVNGTAVYGEEEGENRVSYDIYEVDKPLVKISDYFGNTIEYHGGSELPLTMATIVADSRYEVKVAGQTVPKDAISVSDNKDYDALKNYVQELPVIYTYNIAVLVQDASVEVWDQYGLPVELATGETIHDLLERMKGEEQVPEEITEEVDLLQIAHDWSLFMSNDKPFVDISKYMIKDSYQYNMAKSYATGVDITFTSTHSLDKQPFTEDLVTNFQWIAEDCFSVDISFVKHMVLSYGAKVDDPMNDCFYFVKYDDTDDGNNNPQWKMVSMKEIVNNEK